MKNKSLTISLLTFAVSLLLSACVPTLHPLYTPETIVFREDLLGVWKEAPDDKESWSFAKADENTYKVTIVDSDGISKFEGRLVKLDDLLFLDLSPLEDSLKNAGLGAFYKASLIPGHLILKVKLGNKLDLQLFEAEALEDLLSKSPGALAHTFVQKDRLVITATTAELQKFVKAHGNSSTLWSKPSDFKKQD